MCALRVHSYIPVFMPNWDYCSGCQFWCFLRIHFLVFYAVVLSLVQPFVNLFFFLSAFLYRALLGKWVLWKEINLGQLIWSLYRHLCEAFLLARRQPIGAAKLEDHMELICNGLWYQLVFSLPAVQACIGPQVS